MFSLQICTVAERVQRTTHEDKHMQIEQTNKQLAKYATRQRW